MTAEADGVPGSLNALIRSAKPGRINCRCSATTIRARRSYGLIEMSRSSVGLTSAQMSL